LAPNTWDLFDFDVKLDPANGFVVASVSKADGSEAASITWNGATGTDGDANAYYSAWGARASVHSLSSSVATSTDLNYFITMGPVLVYEPAG
jgi:hypothetical protein